MECKKLCTFPSEADYLCRLVFVADWLILGVIATIVNCELWIVNWYDCECPHYLSQISSQCKSIRGADQGQNILSQEYCLQPCAGLVSSFLFQQVGVPAGLVIGNSRLNNEKYYDIIFFHKNIFFSRQNIVCGFLQVWSGLVIGNFRLNKRKEITISFAFATCSLSNWCHEWYHDLELVGQKRFISDILDIFIRSVIFSSKGKVHRKKSKKTLPKALRTQELTALTSNFGLVGLVQYAW